jgi:hypothetical protein
MVSIQNFIDWCRNNMISLEYTNIEDLELSGITIDNQFGSINLNISGCTNCKDAIKECINCTADYLK